MFRNQLTRYQSEEFSYLTNAKVYAYNKREQIFIQIAKLKKFSTLKNSPFPLTRNVKVHRRALVLLPCLIPCFRCENSQLSCNVTTYTREPTTRGGLARIYDVRMGQFVLKIEKLSHIMGPRGYGPRPRLWLLILFKFVESS